jgi:hypothetical protein
MIQFDLIYLLNFHTVSYRFHLSLTWNCLLKHVYYVYYINLPTFRERRTGFTSSLGTTLTWMDLHKFRYIRVSRMNLRKTEELWLTVQSSTRMSEFLRNITGQTLTMHACISKYYREIYAMQNAAKQYLNIHRLI